MTHIYLISSTVFLGITALIGIIWLADRKGRAELQKEQHNETMRRLREAIEADSRNRERIARGELLQDDGFRRD